MVCACMQRYKGHIKNIQGCHYHRRNIAHDSATACAPFARASSSERPHKLRPSLGRCSFFFSLLPLSPLSHLWAMVAPTASTSTATSSSSPSSPSPSPSSAFDVLACGFGPASLALAIALVEHSDRPVPTFSSLGGLQQALQGDSAAPSPTAHAAGREAPLRACFIEKHDKFKWHPGMMLEGSNMQICKYQPPKPYDRSDGKLTRLLARPPALRRCHRTAFLKDLATLRNPQSAYTFLCYLSSFTPSRLVSYISRETFTPTRREFVSRLGRRSIWQAPRVLF